MEPLKPSATFSSLKIDEWLIKQCKSLGKGTVYLIDFQFYIVTLFYFSGIEKPTPVQASCIPPILAGQDCIGCDRTGSGKTFAFALPIVQTLSKDPFGIYALILTPTRELAYQV